MSALDAAVALEEVDSVTMLITEYLDLHVPACEEEKEGGREGGREGGKRRREGGKRERRR